MKITLNIENDRKLSKAQIEELTDSLLAYADEIIDDLTFLDDGEEEKIDSEPKPKKKATAKKAAPKKAAAKKKGGK